MIKLVCDLGYAPKHSKVSYTGEMSQEQYDIRMSYLERNMNGEHLDLNLVPKQFFLRLGIDFSLNIARKTLNETIQHLDEQYVKLKPILDAGTKFQELVFGESNIPQTKEEFMNVKSRKNKFEQLFIFTKHVGNDFSQKNEIEIIKTLDNLLKKGFDTKHLPVYPSVFSWGYYGNDFNMQRFLKERKEYLKI